MERQRRGPCAPPLKLDDPPWRPATHPQHFVLARACRWRSERANYDGPGGWSPPLIGAWSTAALLPRSLCLQAVRDLQRGDTAHFVHLDGNLLVADSAKGTVFLNFMIQGSLNISGDVQPAPDRPYPSVAAATVVGLTDHDINVMDDQSVVITDYYSEQIKTGHLTMSGSGKSGRSPGRVTISAVKSSCYTSSEITVNNYHGSLIYANSLFFEGPPVVIAQSGAALVNITMLGNGFNGSSIKQALTWELGAGGRGRNSAVGNLVPCMNCKTPLPALLYPDTEAAAASGGAATTNGTIAAAIDDWRRLGPSIPADPLSVSSRAFRSRPI